MGKVSVKWIESQLMIGVDSLGHTLAIGSWPEREPEWAAMKASDLLMLSAASCSAYDVVMILRKQKANLVDFEVEVTGDQDPDPPNRFTRIHMHYRFKGNLDETKVRKAIALSEDKYCSIICTLRPTVEFSHSVEILRN
jgi:putative redox protein